MLSFDQDRLLDEVMSSAKQAAFQMERHLDKGNVADAIRCASDMLREMRTSFLSPKSYYELYISVTEKLQLLESFLIEEHRSGRKVLNLYEIVQYNPCIIPRLYLLITVGVYLIKCCDSSRREIMRDLVEMCCGVQHPIRGLFLRSYLLHALRAELLPFSGDLVQHADNVNSELCKPTPALATSAAANNQGTLTDSVDFLLFNFAEMNKLWVRMQHQGHSRDRERREQERRELRLLVGTNLNRLAQLDTIDVVRYQKDILPPILEQLVKCHDIIAQEYLMDVIIQAFPDEFHLATLPVLLNTCSRLQPGVKPRGIICSLIERLSQFAVSLISTGDSLTLPTSAADSIDCAASVGTQHVAEISSIEPVSQTSASAMKLFTIFFNGISTILDDRISSIEKETDGSDLQNRRLLVPKLAAYGLPAEDLPATYAALVYLVMVLYPDQSEVHVNACLNFVADLLERIGVNQISPASPLSRELLNLLHVPMGGVSPFSNTPHRSIRVTFGVTGGLRTVLKMSGFRRLVSLLDPKTSKCRLACNLLSGALEYAQQQQKPVSMGLSDSCSTATALSYNACRLTTESDVENLFELISVLLTPDSVHSDDPDEFAEIQSLVSGVLHLLGPRPRTENPGLCYVLLCKAEALLSEAGAAVIRFNFPALVFEGLQLIRAYAEIDNKHEIWDQDVQNVVTFVYQCITKLISSGSSDLAVRLLLKAALAIDRIEFIKREPMAYEFVSQALTLYEEVVSEARAQIDAISLISSTLCQMRCFGEDNRKTLRTQCTRAAAHLLRKHDQSRAVAATAHCFWPVPILDRNNIQPAVLANLSEKSDKSHVSLVANEEITEAELNTLRDGKGAVSCLDRASKLAEECMDHTVRAQLLLNILNHSISLRRNGCSDVTDERLNKLIEMSESSISELHPSPASEDLSRHLSQTLSFINNSKSNDNRGNEDPVVGVSTSVNAR